MSPWNGSAATATLRLVHRLRRAGPRAAADRITVGIVATTLLLAAAFTIVGLVSRSDPGRWFGEGKPGTLLSVVLLSAGGVVSISAGLSLGRGPLRLGWCAFGLLLITAAVDDMLKGHEAADRWLNALLGWDPAGAGDILDDLLVLAYAAPGTVLVGVLMRRYALRLAGLVWNLVFGAGFFGCMVLLDILDSANWLEETFKLLAAAFILSGVLAARLSPLHRRLARLASQRSTGASASTAAGRSGSHAVTQAR